MLIGGADINTLVSSFVSAEWQKSDSLVDGM